MTSFRIVQLTDLHLTDADDDPRSEPRLFGKLEHMNRRFRALAASPLVQRANLVLVTGDVTDSGSPASWKVFRDTIRSAGLSRRCLVVPGNHDVCCLGLRAPRKGLYKKDLDRVRRQLRNAGQPGRFPWACRVDRRVVVFGVESSNPGNLSAVNNAVGEIGFYQLERLARLLKKHQGVPVKIIALHHSPNIPGKETEEKRGLPVTGAVSRLAHEVPESDRRALRLLGVAHGVRLIVHGHLHRAEDRRVNGIRIVGAPASTQPLASDAGRVGVYSYLVQGNGGRVVVRLHSVECPST